MKKDIDNTFVRYGRMHLTKQKGYGKDTFHAPPASIGFYAMPIRFQELFLVGSIETTQPDQIKMSKKLKEDPDNVDWDKYNEIHKKKWKKIIHKFEMNNEDFIWHHLDAKNNVIVDKNNNWIKTTVRDWKISLIKESLKLRVWSMGSMFGEKEHNKTPLAEVRPKTGYYSKDHFEVFIDHKVC
jgi:hypothetical protein